MSFQDTGRLPATLFVAGAADLAHTTKAAVYAAVQSGRLACVLRGTKMLFRTEDVVTWSDAVNRERDIDRAGREKLAQEKYEERYAAHFGRPA